ncbi:hypothetical protein GIB67_009750 [Kingdonia uniflora]|uniref:Alpha-aminoadipic semialdehyde synthase n=1 Tax=Kingdonia uniflora TaxID=39325 RepID=A0A7J7LBB2_9MAGN|nr:hypothetical protein GIB67_009750 [Kingdonia uniflora]
MNLGVNDFKSNNTSFYFIFLYVLFRYDSYYNTYHHDMEGKGVICLAIDILPTEFAKEASKHFGDILSQFIGSLASSKDLSDLPSHLRRACIVHEGELTSLYEYIPRMRNSDSNGASENSENGLYKKKKHNISVSLSGHLFDQFLINEALDIIEAAGGTFHLVRCQVGQSALAMSYSDLESLTGGGHSHLEAGAYQAEGLRVPTGLKMYMVDKNPTEKSEKITKQWEIARKASEERAISFDNMQGHIWEPGGSNFSQPGVLKIILFSMYVRAIAKIEEIEAGVVMEKSMRFDEVTKDNGFRAETKNVESDKMTLRQPPRKKGTARESDNDAFDDTVGPFWTEDIREADPSVARVLEDTVMVLRELVGKVVGADDSAVLDQIIDSLTSIANLNENFGVFNEITKKISLSVGKVCKSVAEEGVNMRNRPAVLILGAGRVCRPAAEFLASIGSISSRQWFNSCFGDDVEMLKDVQVIVASLYLKDAEETVEGIPNATAIQLDILDNGSLLECISQATVVISLLPPSCHVVIAETCIELKKNLVTASYVDESMSKLDEKAKDSGITILGEMGLDPGIDHMMAMKMINEAHARRGKIKSFASYCGGLPSPSAANNPLAYKFSWNPAGAIRAGRNPATYKYLGEVVNVDGDKLYDSATKFRIPDFPAFALECLPNRNSLVYGDFYGIGHEASTLFRGTLRYEGDHPVEKNQTLSASEHTHTYEGFGEIMANLAKIGLFDAEAHPILKEEKRPLFGTFLDDLLKIERKNASLKGTTSDEKEMVERLVKLGICKEKATAEKTVKTIKFLGLYENTEIPLSCRSAFDVTCLCMQERLAYSNTEQDMVLLHHEVEVEFPDGRPTENHRATLLEFGRTESGKTTTAMALTVGIPAAIGALLLLENKIKTKGVLRPLEPEVYVPALDILEAYGFKLLENME